MKKDKRVEMMAFVAKVLLCLLVFTAILSSCAPASDLATQTANQATNQSEIDYKPLKFVYPDVSMVCFVEPRTAVMFCDKYTP